MRILLVEDDRAVRITVRDALVEAGHDVEEHADGPAALRALGGRVFDLLLTDIRLPGGMDGVALFRQVRAQQPDCAAILMTAYGRVDDAVAVMREGASDYITKPFEVDELVMRIDRLGEEAHFREVMGKGQSSNGFRGLLGESAKMQQVRERIEAAARSGVGVLITGETGTGKDLCARTLHKLSERANNPFMALNCAAIPSELFEAELFGHERGAFTGAVRRREGRMQAADKGTLFMDEVGELSLDHQAKLLRAIETGSYEPVGSNRAQSADVWLVSATNQDLRRMVALHTFRQDLYFRLNVIEIHMPPLRELRRDIPVLVSDFLRNAASRRGVAVPELSPAAMAALLAYDYPGNVRELFHALEHGLALSQGRPIDVAHLPSTLQEASQGPERETDDWVPLQEAVRQFERTYIQQALEQSDGKRGEAAKLLGISRKSLWQKLKE